MCEEAKEELSAREDRAAMSAFYGCSETAFDVLHDRWWPRLFGFFRREGIPVEDAEDLALLTLIKLYTTKERQSFDLTRPLSPFLFTVARRVLLGWLRDEGRRIRGVSLIEALDLATEIEDRHPTLSAAVAECIQGLPPIEQRYILHCEKHGLGDMSHGEIAAALDKWPAQITQISKSARASLEQCLRGKGYS